MDAKVTIAALQAMKREGKKSVGVVAWDYQIARIADRAGVDIVSVGDSVGINLWGHSNPLEVTMEEMLVVCKAVRRGVTRALVSCDFPFGPLQERTDAAVRAAIRLVKEAGADLVKLDGAADFPDAVRAIVSRGGRPDLAGAALTRVQAPTLLIVGEHDDQVVQLNRQALTQLRCEKRLVIVPGATHLFEEPGALDEVARLARDWFQRHLDV